VGVKSPSTSHDPPPIEFWIGYPLGSFQVTSVAAVTPEEHIKFKGVLLPYPNTSDAFRCAMIYRACSSWQSCALFFGDMASALLPPRPQFARTWSYLELFFNFTSGWISRSSFPLAETYSTIGGKHRSPFPKRCISSGFSRKCPQDRDPNFPPGTTVFFIFYFFWFFLRGLSVKPIEKLNSSSAVTDKCFLPPC
jgi:hypothetical protein